MTTRTVSLGLVFAIGLMALVTPLSAQNLVKVASIRAWSDGYVDIEFSGHICDVDGQAQNWGQLNPGEPGNLRNTRSCQVTP